MQKRAVIVVGVFTVVLLVGLIGLSLFLTPDQVNPAFAAAVDFTNAAAKGDEVTVRQILVDNLQTYIDENCEDGLIENCVQSYTPADWGDMISAVFRRSDPDGTNAWDVLLVATYEEAQGFSGVCIYNRVEKQAIETTTDDKYQGWRVVGWSGFVSCDRNDAGLSALAGDDAPNHVP